MELEKKKQDILKWFEKNINKFSREKQEDLSDIDRELGETEKEWFDIQGEIERLEVELENLK